MLNVFDMKLQLIFQIVDNILIIKSNTHYLPFV